MRNSKKTSPSPLSRFPAPSPFFLLMLLFLVSLPLMGESCVSHNDRPADEVGYDGYDAEHEADRARVSNAMQADQNRRESEYKAGVEANAAKRGW